MKKKTKLIGYIIGIIIFILTISGITYAMYRYVLFVDLNISATNKGLDKYIEYTKGININGSTLNPGTSYTSGSGATVSFYKKNNVYDIYGHIYLDITSINSILSSSGALKYVVLDGSDNIIGQGSVQNVENGDSVLAATNIPLVISPSSYTVYIWLDEELYDSSFASSSFNINVRCYATMEELE